MGKTYSLVVFDWEGTLGDTLGQLINTVSDEAKKLGFGEVDEQSARDYVSLGLVVAVKKLFPDLSEDNHKTLMLAVQNSLVTHGSEIYLLPGAFEILECLKKSGVDLAVATNKGEQALRRSLKLSKLEQFFTVTRTASQSPCKPCPQMLEEIMQHCGVTPEQTLMVGDSIMDIEMANNAGVDAVGIDFYDNQSSNLLAYGAIEVFENYQQLAAYLQLSDFKKINTIE